MKARKDSRSLVALFSVAAAALPALRAQVVEPPPPPPGEIEVQVLEDVSGDTVRLELGEAPPAAAWGPWQRGEPAPIGGDKAAPCTVFVFYATPKAEAESAIEADVDYLAELQQRFAEKGVRFVAVVADPETKMPASWAPWGAVVDREQQVAAAWGAVRGQHVVVLDHGGKTSFQGDPGNGLVDAIAGVLDGSFEVGKARDRIMMRDALAADFENVAARFDPAALADNAGRDGQTWGILYAAAANRPPFADAAMPVAKAAVERLAKDSRPLAVFADIALRSDARAPGLALELSAALQPASAAAPSDPWVQLAYLRALVIADRGREVGRQAAKTARLVRSSAEHSLAFAEILVRAATPVVHGDLVRQAIARAAELGAAPRLVTATRYAALLRCDEDPAAAKALLNEYLAEVQIRTQINNDCWYLMTELPTMGRFDWFAAALADRMLEQRDNMDYFEFDTVALAMFQVGRYEDAVANQETAIQKGGADNPEYTGRLDRYKARVAAAPR